jgi:gelsolin
MLKDRPMLKIEETNMALFGSDLEKKIKAAAAGGEAAWKGCGQKEGLEIWRIEKFKVVPWPKSRYGSFFDGDSYIVLHTRKEDDKLKWNIHFWLGKYTSQDEYGTAAYKTVELDDYLGGSPVQYREVDENESTQFLSLFKCFQVLQGGIESGFKHYTERPNDPRLLWVKGHLKNVTVHQIDFSDRGKYFNQGDAFILDCGPEGIWTVFGTSTSVGERTKATQVVEAIQEERKKDYPHFSCRFGDGDEQMTEFWKRVGGEVPVLPAGSVVTDHAGHGGVAGSAKRLLKISDERTGSLEYFEVKNPTKASLDTKDCFIAWDGATCWIWVGHGSNKAEQRTAVFVAQKYVNEAVPNKRVSIVTITEGNEPKDFLKMWA